MVMIQHHAKAADVQMCAFGGVGQRIGDQRVGQLAGQQQEFALGTTPGNEVVGATAAVGWSHPTGIDSGQQKLRD